MGLIQGLTEFLPVSSSGHLLLVEKLGVSADKVKPEIDIIKDLGADSLDLVEMLLTLEETFGITVSDEQTENISTVQDIVDLIDKK